MPKPKKGNTAFHGTHIKGYSDTVKILMENAAVLRIDVNATTIEG